jgi:putative transposon-encoded protein
MSRKKPVKVYESKVLKLGNSARINAFKSHIGKTAMVVILEEEDDNKSK